MIRGYKDTDFDQVKELYLHKEWYGGVFSKHRDGKDVLARKIANDPEAILVFEQDGGILGTISLIEDGRVAWLYRFIAKDMDSKVSKELFDAAIKILRDRGHKEVLVYSAINGEKLDAHYLEIGMKKGSDYTCFWAEIK